MSAAWPASRRGPARLASRYVEQAPRRYRMVPAASRKSAALVRSQLARAITEAGVAGLPVCLHSSLSAHGFIEGGAAEVVDAFRSEAATVLVPTFSETYEVFPPPADDRPPRNGIDYDRGEPTRPDVPFDADTAGLDPSMGAVPREVLGRPARRRGNHPTCSFSALGPDGRELIAGQRPDDVFAPLRTLADLGGSVVLAGVGLDRMTLLHLAEQMAGRTLFRRWALVGPETVVPVQLGGCSQGFPALESVLAPIERSVQLGAARWRAFPAAAALELAAAAIRERPECTRCADPDCLRCQDAVAGGPQLPDAPA